MFTPEYWLLATSVWWFVTVFYIKTHDDLSIFLFKVIPFFLALGGLLAGVKALGW